MTWPIISHEAVLIWNKITRSQHRASSADTRSQTHLSAHSTMDSDDDKALDRVKNGEEDLKEKNTKCLLVFIHS